MVNCRKNEELLQMNNKHFHTYEIEWKTVIYVVPDKILLES